MNHKKNTCGFGFTASGVFSKRMKTASIRSIIEPKAKDAMRKPTRITGEEIKGKSGNAERSPFRA